MNLNPFSISNLLIILFYFPIAYFILTKGKTKATKVFALYFLSAGMWGLGGFLAATTSNEHAATAYLTFAYCSVLFIPVFFQHATALIIKKETKFFYFFTYGQALYFCFLNLSGKLFTTKWAFNSFYYYDGNAAFFLSFIMWLVVLFYTVFQLVIHYTKNYHNDKKDALFVLLGLFSYLGGINNFLPVFDIDIYPYGNFLVPIHSILITYAILRHQILNIDVVIKRGMVYYTLIALTSVMYLIIAVIIERLLQASLGYKSIFSSVITAFIIGIIFIPLRNSLQYWVDKLFFHKSPTEIEEENKRLRHEIIEAEKLKTITTLASGVAHEIKNPLTAINTFSEQLPKRLNDKEFLEKFSKIVGHEVRRINNLVHELLDFAKPTPPQLRPHNMYKLLDETVELLSSAFLKYNISVQKYLDGIKGLSMKVDENQIRQAIMNICINAIEVMTTGGTLTVASSVQRMANSKNSDSALNANRSTLILSISDTGPGIPAKDLPHIFDPFFSTKDGGTGLGLSITRSIIEQHAGEITVESTVGMGTTFTFKLPLTRNT